MNSNMFRSGFLHFRDKYLWYDSSFQEQFMWIWLMKLFLVSNLAQISTIYILHMRAPPLCIGCIGSNPNTTQNLCAKPGGSSCRSQQAQGGQWIESLLLNHVNLYPKNPCVRGKRLGRRFSYRRYHGVFLKQNSIDLFCCWIVYRLICGCFRK